MLENESKGSYGAFSTYGRITAESFVNIKRKDKILNPRKRRKNKDIIINFLKRNNYQNIEGEKEEEKEPNLKDLDDSEVEEIEEKSDIFQAKESARSKKKEKKKKDPNSCYHRLNEDAYKFHDMHINKKRQKSKFVTPECTKYFPNKKYIWHRTPTILKWDTMESRKPICKNDYKVRYLGHENPLKNIRNCFITMDKQTMRGDVITSGNVRINSAKPFIAKEKRRKSKDYNRKINLQINNKWKNGKNSEHNMKLLTTDMTDSTNNKRVVSALKREKKSSEEHKNVDKYLKSEFSVDNSDVDSSDLNDSYCKYKNYYTKQVKKENKKENLPQIKSDNSLHGSISINNTSTKSDKKKKGLKTLDAKPLEHKPYIKGPEFDKTIPREYYDNLLDNGLALIPFSINNYTLVRERPLTTVVYKRKQIFKKRKNEFKGINIEQYKNNDGFLYDKCYVPIFNKMNSRPMDDATPLPVFMKGLVSRDVCNIITDTSLKMNYFSEGKSRGNYNTFMPKKSYNKIVNLNILNSKNLINHLLINKKDILQNNDNIIKSILFYNNNYRGLMKEITSNKFDNITYKTIKNKYKL